LRAIAGNMSSKARFLIAMAVGIVAIAGLVVAFSLLSPTPPRTIVMSTGPDGGAYSIFAEKYREHLAENGIDLQLRSSGGAGENLDRLQQPQGDVAVAFVTMGSPGLSDSSNLQSLGAMFFEPLWVFTNSVDLANGNLQALRDMRISIGPPGSRTNSAARGLFKLLGEDTDQLTFATLDPADAANGLKQGEIDTVFMVTNAATPIIRDLLATPDIKLINFERASAFTALYPALKKLVVPAGVGSFAQNLPPEDVNILAFTAILAVRDDLHPAIQTLLLDAASQIHAVPDLFHADGRFPSSDVYRIALSSNASSYYTSGRPFLQRYLPFWLAVLVMQLLVAALPLIGIVYPALKFMPSAYDWAMRRRIFRLYGELRSLEFQLAECESEEDKTRLVRKLDDLEQKVRDLKIPINFSSFVFALRSHINVVRAKYP